MFLFVVAVLFGLVALGLIVKGNVQGPETEASYRRRDRWSYRSQGDPPEKEYHNIPLRLIGLGVAALAGLLFLWSAAFSTDSGEATLVKSPSGEVVGFDTSPGVGFTMPWNKTSTWDLRQVRLTFEGNGDDVDGPAIGVALDGSANGATNLVVTYSLPRDRETLTRLEREHRNQDNFEENVLIPSLKSVVQDEAVEFGPYVIKEERGTLDANVTNALMERWAEEGAEVQGIEITGISLDEATEAKLQEVTASQAAVASSEAELEAARIQGETVREQAKADADADQIARCGATTQSVNREVSGRVIETTQVIPRAGAECENRLNEQVLLNKWIEAIAANNRAIVVPMELESILNLPAAAAG